MTLPLTRREMVQRLAASAAFTSLLAETGCGSLTTDIELIITTTSAAVDIAFPQYAALLNPYFTQVTTFIDQATAELASSDSPAQKAAVIAGAAAAIVAPNLSGVGADIAARVAAIAPLIAKLVDEIKASSAIVTEAPGGANAFFAVHKTLKTPSAEQLAKIKAKNAALKARLKRSEFHRDFFGRQPNDSRCGRCKPDQSSLVRAEEEAIIESIKRSLGK